MSAGRKARGGVSFRVVEGGRGLHRQPLVPADPAPCVACLLVAAAMAWAVLALVAAILWSPT